MSVLMDAHSQLVILLIGEDPISGLCLIKRRGFKVPANTVDGSLARFFTQGLFPKMDVVMLVSAAMWRYFGIPKGLVFSVSVLGLVFGSQSRHVAGTTGKHAPCTPNNFSNPPPPPSPRKR